MKRTAALVLLLATGCSTAPIADVLDFIKPSRLESNAPYYGGVGAPPPSGAVVVPPVPPAGIIPPPPP